MARTRLGDITVLYNLLNSVKSKLNCFFGWLENLTYVRSDIPDKRELSKSLEFDDDDLFQFPQSNKPPGPVDTPDFTSRRTISKKEVEYAHDFGCSTKGHPITLGEMWSFLLNLCEKYGHDATVVGSSIGPAYAALSILQVRQETDKEYTARLRSQYILAEETVSKIRTILPPKEESQDD